MTVFKVDGSDISLIYQEIEDLGGEKNILNWFKDLGKEATINSCDQEGCSLLGRVSKEGLGKAVDVLLSFGSNPDSAQQKNNRPLYHAIKNGHYQIAETLIRTGADVQSVLTTAVQNNDAQTVVLLSKVLEEKFPEHELNKFVAFEAALLEKEEMQIEVAINAMDSRQRTTRLNQAISDGDEFVAEILIKYGTDCDLKDDYGYTPLHVAIAKDNEAVVKLLISAGVNVNIQITGPEFSPLLYAVETGNNKLVPVLLEAGADISLVDIRGNSCLHSAVVSKNAEIVAVLLQQKEIDLSLQDMEGSTAFHLLAEYYSSEVALLLLNNTIAPLEVVNHKGERPLDLACEKNNMEYAERLLERGVSRKCVGECTTPPVYRGYEENAGFKALFSSSEIAYDQLSQLGHVLHAKGELNFHGMPLDLEGSRNQTMYPPLLLAIESLGSIHREIPLTELEGKKIDIIKKAYQTAYEESVINFNNLQRKKLVFVTAGWENHAIELVFFGDYMGVCNTGE
ncbi:MAG: ankyrin repeat domain-containing protein, partial [Simkaniaceae bacterium]|nr:ankyrin repeat domain-containing protein [Simkaniaceae bacterium]